MLTKRLALYTTIYTGVEQYLPSWYESILAQTDRNFDIWIGLDGLDTNSVVATIGKNVPATWVTAETDDSPAQLRDRAIARMVSEYPAIVFVDSDDVLDPTRVEAARESLFKHDVNGCAQRIIDKHGKDTGIIFQPRPGEKIGTVLPRNNIFGLSNSAYRADILARCLPIPAECILVDWFLITRAWGMDALLSFDSTCRMNYRQCATNTARVLPPFTVEYIILATERVLNHYRMIFENAPEVKNQHRITLQAARDHVEIFYNSVSTSTDTLDLYVQTLNQLPPEHIWWSCVAHPQLEDIWKH